MLTRSKSCQERMNVVAAIPQAAKANPIRRAAGNARIPQNEGMRPMAAITTRNPAA